MYYRVTMKFIGFIIFMFIIIIFSCVQTQDIDNHTNCVNFTQLITEALDSNVYRFNIILPYSYDGEYYLDMTIKFKNTVSHYYVYFGETYHKHPNIEAKGVTMQDTIILSTYEGPKNGWDSDGLACGRFQGYIRSETPVTSVIMWLNAPNSSIDLSPEC